MVADFIQIFIFKHKIAGYLWVLKTNIGHCLGHKDSMQLICERQHFPWEIYHLLNATVTWGPSINQQGNYNTKDNSKGIRKIYQPGKLKNELPTTSVTAMLQNFPSVL